VSDDLATELAIRHRHSRLGPPAIVLHDYCRCSRRNRDNGDAVLADFARAQTIIDVVERATGYGNRLELSSHPSLSWQVDPHRDMLKRRRVEASKYFY
jgi:hypothetical protein